MNLPNSNQQTTAAIAGAARAAYCDDRRSDAALLYEEAAEQALHAGRVSEAMEHLRWRGNSLIWDSRHDEALQILLRIANDKHPQTDPSSVFGAKTDCIMVSLFHAPACSTRALIEDAYRYLAQVGKEHWCHRLQLQTGIQFARQGRFEEAYEICSRSYRSMRAVNDGPHFTDLSHLKWIVRAAFRLERDDEIAGWLEATSHLPFTMVSDRIRVICIRLAHARLLRRQGRPFPGLLQDVRQGLSIVAESGYVWEEYYEIARALLVAGELDAVLRLCPREPVILRFEDAALAVELQINCLRRDLGLPAWDPELNWPNDLPTHRAGPYIVPPVREKSLTDAMTRLIQIAHAEDARLETGYYSRETTLRCTQANELLSLAKRQQPDFSNRLD